MKMIDKRLLFKQLGYVPHVGQEQIHAALSVPDIDYVLGLCGTRFGKCARGNTEVYDLSTGRRRRVDELGPLLVQSWNEQTLKAEPRLAEAFASGRKPCVRVTLTSGQQIELSTDHPILTEVGWVEAALVQPGALVATPRSVPEPEHPLHVSDAEVVVLAALMADGSHSARGVQFTQMPGEMLNEFSSAVANLGGSMHRLQDSGKAQQFSLSGMLPFTRKWGLQGLTHDKIRLPAEFYGLASDQIGRFLSIFWACDGWFQVKDKIAALTLANRLLLEDFRHLLLRLGIHGLIRRNDKVCTNAKNGPVRCEAWTLSVTGAENLRSLCTAMGHVPGKQHYVDQLKSLFGKIGGRSDSDVVPIGRHQIKFIARELQLTSRECRDTHFGCTEGHVLTRAKFEKGVNATNYQGRFTPLANSDVLWSRVKSVEAIGEHDVYDLSVEETHNFAANNVIIHNTWSAAYEMVYHAMLPRKEFLGWCVAPQRALADIVFDQVGRIIHEIHGAANVRYDRNEGVLEFTNFGGGRSRIMRKSCDGAEGKGKLAGAGVDFMVIDEASSPTIKDQIWVSELSTRLNAGSKLLAISTPRGQRGWFITLYRQAKRVGRTSRAISINLPSWTNTYRFPGGWDNPEIQAKYARMALRDFLQEYGAQPMSAEGAFFDPEFVDPCCVINEWEEPSAAGEYASGLDLGLKRDSSVHTIVRAPLGFANASPAAKVVFVRRMHRMPVEAQLELVLQDQQRFGIQCVYTDGTGIGEPIIQQARNMGIFVRSVVFTKQSKMPLMTNLLGLMQQLKVRLPSAILCPALRDQLVTYEWDKAGKTANAPDGFHDDYVCSLALACKFFPAIGSQGEGQVFHVNKHGSEGHPTRMQQRPRAQDEQPKVRVIRAATPDEVQTFTSKRPGGGRGLWGTNDVLG